MDTSAPKLLITIILFFVGLMYIISILASNQMKKPCNQYLNIRVSEIPARCLEYYKTSKI